MIRREYEERWEKFLDWYRETHPNWKPRIYFNGYTYR